MTVLRMADAASARHHASQHAKQAAVSLISSAKTRTRNNLKVIEGAALKQAALLRWIDF